MIACPRCGTENDESAKACSLCGTKLSDGKPEAEPRASESKPEAEGEAKAEPEGETKAEPEGETKAEPEGETKAPVEATPPPEGEPKPAAATKRPDFARTLLGQGPLAAAAISRPAPTPPAEPPPLTQPIPAAPAPALAGLGRGTIMGMGIPLPAAPASPPPQEPQTLPHPAPPPPPAGAALGNRTVMGLAPPPPVEPGGLGGTMVMQPAQRTLVGNPPAPANTPTEGGAKPPTKTILGVARPGIAPINPGMAKAPAPETFPSPPPPPPLLEPYAEPGESISPELPRRTSVLAMLVIVAAVVMLAGAGAALYVFRGPGTIEAKPGLETDGSERLDLTCAGCKDGTTIALGSHQSTVTGGRAKLALPGPLQVGENRFELALKAPGSSRENRVSLTVPLEFRVRADTAPLADPTPHLAIVIEAVPGSVVVVDGKPISLPPDGRTRHDVEVVPELTGLDTAVRRLERKVAYSITPPGRPAETGQVTFQVGIVPLSIDAPGESITIETSTFVLAGRTQKGGVVSVSGRPLAVDAEGRFEQTMSVSSPGETSVTARASIADSAPRLYSFKVRRVNSLRDEARARRSGAVASYATLVAESAKAQGTAVALDGTVIELSHAGNSTLLLLDTKVGCAKAPCIVRVLHGARVTIAIGDDVSAFGKLRGSVEGVRKGTRVPEVFADFVLKGRR